MEIVEEAKQTHGNWQLDFQHRDLEEAFLAEELRSRSSKRVSMPLLHLHRNEMRFKQLLKLNILAKE